MFQKAGKTRLKPKISKNITAKVLIVSAGIPKNRTTAAKEREAIVKLSIIPIITPLIRQSFPSTPLAKITGSTGKTQRVKTVKIPDMNAIGNSSNIVNLKQQIAKIHFRFKIYNVNLPFTI